MKTTLSKFVRAIALVVAILVSFSACASNNNTDNSKTWLQIYSNQLKDPKYNLGKYKNIYKGCNDLAGVEVYQFPIGDNALENYDYYIGKQPGTIVYHFWDGRIREMGFSPEGTVTGDAWFSHAQGEHPEYYTSWEMVDFSKGSDPHFKLHKDPRRQTGYGLFP